MTTATKPAALSVNLAGIPAELQAQPQWVGWRLTWRDGKWTKEPIDPHTGGLGSSTDPTTWGTITDALTRMDGDSLDGIGYMFSADDPFTGIDLDTCRDPLTEHIEPWAMAIVTDLASYTERSPSETGLHIIVRATKPGERSRRGAIEMYDRERYFTFTGHWLPGTPAGIEARQAALAALYRQTFGEADGSRPPLSPNGRYELSDDAVLALARKAANAPKFLRLWAGDTSGHDNDDSVADLALLSILAFYTGDAGQLDRLFRRSGLMREKWDRADYRARTITKALEQRETYEPPGTRPHRAGLNGASEAADRGDEAGGSLPAVEPFPIHVLPAAVRAFVTSAAVSIGCPVDYLAVPLLGLAEGCIGKSRRLVLRAGFEVSPGSWYGVVGESGCGKSPALKRALAVMKPLQDAAWETYLDKLTAWEALAKAERGDKPTPEHFFITDSTGEALWAALASSAGVAQVEDELRRRLKALDQYRTGGDRQAMLAAWSNAPVKIVRRTSAPVYIPFPVAPLIGGIQPGVLKYLRGEGEDAEADDGWVPRFLLCWPDAEPLDLSDVPFDAATQPPVEDVFSRLRLFGNEPLDTRLTDTAFVRFREWHGDNRHIQTRARGFERQWAAKAPTHLARLALVLHLFANPSASASVSGETIDAAIELTEYFRDHLARVLPAFGATATVRLSTRITRIIRMAGQETEGGWVARTTILDKLRNVAPDALTAALSALEGTGRLEARRVTTETKPRQEWRIVRNAARGDSGYSGYSTPEGENPNNPNTRTDESEWEEWSV